VIGVDLVMCSQRDVLGLRGDIRALPIARGSIDFVACVSTIEHVGHDNSRYGATATTASTDATVDALAELRRVLSRRGRLLVTVPVGRPEDHGWFRQFDVAGWRAAVAGAGLHSLEEELFARDPDGGWRQCGPADVADVGYGTTGPGAGAVLCTTLVR
jgi:SAM-dependent methyltransferase